MHSSTVPSELVGANSNSEVTSCSLTNSGSPGCLVHKNTAQFVGLVHLQVLVDHGVQQGDFPGRGGRMLSVHRGDAPSLRYTLKLVVNGAQVDSGVVPGNRNVGNLYQFVSLVALTGQFLQDVSVVGQGAEH